MNEILFEQMTPETYKVTDVLSGAVCTFTAGAFNTSQAWNVDKVKIESGKDTAVQMAQAARRVAEYVRTKHFELI
jgi:hypothetical protein